ncbi:hypothetical protein HPB51_018225 [Rhipicephalus microplus]|uniref:Uncharacterized protein n=1 Tax=Rhipicephalus microplus TaxID=6941 RepID=A0A9J6E2R3_RHIMP|nr:hypothetical protein HPB51_018225 [Rhipicephalus microplus]
MHYVPGAYNKNLLCAASNPVVRKRKAHESVLETARENEDVTVETENEIDHVKMLEIMTKRLQIETHYAQAKAVLRPEYLLVLKEILDYNTPSVNINNALQAAKRKIAVSSTMVAVWSSINNLNTLINAFDVANIYRFTVERAYVVGRIIEQRMLNNNSNIDNILPQMRSIIVLPILLILDSYDQIYQCGGLGNICTFQKCTNVVLHKHPRLYDPTTQCAIYHKTLCDMHVDIKDGDSYHNLILKYLRIVFFGRYANSRSENEKEYAPIFKLIRTWYQFIACMMLNTSSASHSSIMSYTKRPAISPNAKMVL